MDSSWPDWIVTLDGLYLALGLPFAVAFVFAGVRRVDPGAKDGTLGFRLLILPGSVVFWPLLMWRWITGAPPPDEINRHRRTG